jgi:molybdenum cofactor cytidylyltransferase
MNEVAAIVLAAGRSQRMGAFKPLLPFGDNTVIETCIDHLREGGVGTIVVVLGYRADKIRDRLKSLPLLFALNPDRNSEMGASIDCGVQKLPKSIRAIIIALADQPAVPSDVVSTLIEEWKRGARLVVPAFQGHGGHPVLIDFSLREELTKIDPQRGLKALFDAHADEVRRVSVNSPYIARDLDTWDDYSTLHQEIFGTLPPCAMG